MRPVLPRPHQTTNLGVGRSNRSGRAIQFVRPEDVGNGPPLTGGAFHNTLVQTVPGGLSGAMSLSTPQAIPEDLDAVKDWFRELAEHVRAVDFAAARHLFAEDFVAFGTFTDFMIGRDLAENNQWRNVWPTIDRFVWRLDDAKALVSPDRLFAVGLAVWDSTGYHPDGKPFDRKGRATVSFSRAKVGAPWVASHTHMSLFRGTPDVSHGMKPSKS